MNSRYPIFLASAGILRGALIAALLLATGCEIASDQQRPSESSRRFVTATTGEEIGSVLILPMYSEQKGVSTGAGGHGKGYMRSSYVIASPFEYRSNKSFVVPPSHARGLVLPWLFFAGHSTYLRGVIALAKGHK